MRVLLCRTDRLGDLILTTPAISALRDQIPDAYIGLIVSDYAAPLVRNHPDKNGVHVLVRDGIHQGITGWRKLVSEIKKGQWDAAVVFNNDFFVASALRAAGIKTRVGLKSRIYSPLLYTHPVRQRRSQVKMHEADYGLELLSSIGIEAGPGKYPTQVLPDKDSIIKAKVFLKDAGMRSEGEYIVIHPGMGGSALNWPLKSWSELIDSFLAQGRQVVLTTHGKKEESQAREILTGIEKSSSVCLFSDRSLNELIGLISGSALLIAPSTGPLHLAVALGRKVIGIYPPIRVQSVKRWGPYLNEFEQTDSVVFPQVDCPEVFHCRGKSCVYFNCMEKVSSEAVSQLAQKRLGV